MNKIVPSIILTIFIVNVIGHIGYASATWHVKWYEIDRSSHEFKKFLGSENWSVGSFNKNWGHGTLYDDAKDYVGFIATSTIYSDGKNYTFELYNVDDEATLFLDGKEILHTLSRKSVDIYIPKGEHTLEIKYIETCCKASIGFSTNESLFIKKQFNNASNKIFVGIAIGIIILATIITIIYYKNYKKP